MSFGGVEMGVSRHNVALVHQVGEEYIFGSASLVGGDNVFKSGEAGDDFFQFEEWGGSGIAFVTQHHACPLAVAHGAGAWVGDEVDINLFRFELEYVVVGFFQPLFAFLAGTFTDRFHHFDFPCFGKW